MILLGLLAMGGHVVGGWRPGIGDPTLAGWLTVADYALATTLCFRAMRASARQPSDRGARKVWLLLTLVMLGLGINKQLDLQTALTEAGRLMARLGGWYDHRRPIQFVFVIFIGLVAFGAAAWLQRQRFASTGAMRLALTGAVLLAGFVVMRAASFHHFDKFIGLRLGGVRFNAIFENGGILLIALGALLAGRRLPTTMRSSTQT